VTGDNRHADGKLFAGGLSEQATRSLGFWVFRIRQTVLPSVRRTSSLLPPAPLEDEFVSLPNWREQFVGKMQALPVMSSAV